MLNLWKPQGSSADNKELVIELKQLFNRLTERRKKAELYLDCNHLKGEELNKAITERDKYILEYQSIMQQLDEITKEFKRLDVGYTELEALEGFEV